VSRTDIEEPRNETPVKLRELPKRAILRILTLLPKLTVSSIERSAPPVVDVPYMDTAEPKRA
jgi:hypothetical protein